MSVHAFAIPQTRIVKVLLVDDHLIVRKGLMQVLNDADDIQVVADAADGVAAMQLIRQWMGPDDGGPHLDVVMLDIAMPGRDGLEVLKQIKGRVPQAAGADAQHLPRPAVCGALPARGRGGLPQQEHRS